MARHAAASGVLALLAASVVLAGCGSVSSTIDPVAAAATKSEKAGGAHVTYTISLSVPGANGGKPSTMTGSGVVDGLQADATFDMGKLLAAVGAPAGTDSSMEERVLQEGGDLVLYMHMEALDSQLHGKHWLRLDVSKLEQGMGIDLSKLPGASATQNPGQMLAMLRASGGDVQKLGSE